MTTDERNFRSSYYEKVGCRGVEEKKSLEILLKERPWDKVKLKQFCLRFTVPAAYRALVWKVLLGILPPYPDSHSFVAEQRAAQHADLAHALTAMALAEDEPPARRLLAMWQLERGVRTTPRLVEESYVNIAEVCLRVLVDEVDAYWVSKALCTLAIPAANRDLPVLQELVFSILLKEEPVLHAHLTALGALPTLPLQQWFACCFAGILDDSSLLKIWDKVVCGANKLLAFVAVVVVCGARRALLAATTAPLALRALHQRPEQCEEVIAAKAIDLWHYYGALPPPPPPPPAAATAAVIAATPAPPPAPALQ